MKLTADFTDCADFEKKDRAQPGEAVWVTWPHSRGVFANDKRERGWYASQP